ncbi:phage portal protein [Brucella sp. TWI559]
MKLIDKLMGRETRSRAPIENPTVAVSSGDFMQFFGLKDGNLPPVTIKSALKLPAVSAAVTFLSSSLANLPLHVYRNRGKGAEKAGGPLQSLLNESPHDEWTSFGWRKYMWQQVFTSGRGLTWIERDLSGNPIAFWPLNNAHVTIKRQAGRKVYEFDAGGGRKEYPASDVIDIPWMLDPDQLNSYSPIISGSKAIALGLAMDEYGSNFFAGGGVPPLALTGPLPAGKDGMKRAAEDIKRSIEHARESNTPIAQIPGGYDLKQIGFDPAKGQMTEARRFQIEEIARIYNLPPVFLQDMTQAKFSNVEQQDLHLVKHLISQWAKAFEEEASLKIFRRRGNRHIEHNLDALMRGDFKSRIEGMARGIQSAILTPNEARALENRPEKENGDQLLIQGATVPLGSQPLLTPPKEIPENGEDRQ